MSYLISASSRFPYIDGVSRDEAVNVVCIAVPDDLDIGVAMDNFQLVMSQLYNSAVSGQAHPIGYYLSQAIDRSRCITTFYRLSDPEPREPVGTRGFAVATAAASTWSLPLQVALCVTLYGTGETTDGSPELSVRRRRGRIYVGPFNVVAMQDANDTDGVAHPLPAMISDMAVAFGTTILTGTPGGGGTGFAIRSRSAGLPVGTKPPKGTVGKATIVTHGLINNEWDIQRRRGVDATSHTDLIVAP